ncbi:hypothetical protein PROVRUST_07874 [Providencia rustigianii DSM 4541]|uniref:Uncharacterized protein n=1 Tax=Providencia rustigianii DSM 4541 TaxID=500637 RepID=D1P6F2_9GAMM|nr:hypothetical protein PROVRUST_07874 [Providencia rustigianii DSM 4541]
MRGGGAVEGARKTNIITPTKCVGVNYRDIYLYSRSRNNT